MSIIILGIDIHRNSLCFRTCSSILIPINDSLKTCSLVVCNYIKFKAKLNNRLQRVKCLAFVNKCQLESGAIPEAVPEY